jgi:hypothetical protein
MLNYPSCFGPALHAGLPREFVMMHDYVRALEFGDTPDYMGLCATLRALRARVGAKYPECRGRVCEACRGHAVWNCTYPQFFPFLYSHKTLHTTLF